MDVFSNLMVIGECLLDTRRTKTFKKAIEETVSKGDIVMDVGTGSGVLGMFAAKAGAKKVYAFDIAEDIAKFAKQNAINNGLDDIIEVENADMKEHHIPHKIDVLIMELLDTALVAEQQAVVINHLHSKGVISKETKLIPYRYLCTFELVEYDFNFYGLNMPFIIQARNFAVERHIKHKLSKNTSYLDIDFSKSIDLNVDTVVSVKIISSGTINALVLKSKTFISKNYALWGTTDMNMPVIIPLDPTSVKKDETLTIHIKYRMGEGFGTFEAQVGKD